MLFHLWDLILRHCDDAAFVIVVVNVVMALVPAALFCIASDYSIILGDLQALRYEKGSAILSTGALAAFSGAKTGRSPLDKRVVEERK